LEPGYSNHVEDRGFDAEYFKKQHAERQHKMKQHLEGLIVSIAPRHLMRSPSQLFKIRCASVHFLSGLGVLIAFQAERERIHKSMARGENGKVDELTERKLKRQRLMKDILDEDPDSNSEVCMLWISLTNSSDLRAATAL
jgi:hypothetical protein